MVDKLSPQTVCFATFTLKFSGGETPDFANPVQPSWPWREDDPDWLKATKRSCTA